MGKEEWKIVLLVGITVIYLIVMVVLFHRFRTAMLKLGEEQRRIQAEKKRQRQLLTGETNDEDADSADSHGQT